MLQNYKSELDYFEKVYSKMSQDDYCKLLKSYLYQLLDLNAINEIVVFYNGTKKNNVILKNFEEEIDTFDDVNILKMRLVSCFIDELLTKYNDLAAKKCS